jgi:hypothetical protein
MRIIETHTKFTQDADRAETATATAAAVVRTKVASHQRLFLRAFSGRRRSDVAVRIGEIVPKSISMVEGDHLVQAMTTSGTPSSKKKLHLAHTSAVTALFPAKMQVPKASRAPDQNCLAFLYTEANLNRPSTVSRCVQGGNHAGAA